jgi:hypothetical protein
MEKQLIITNLEKLDRLVSHNPSMFNDWLEVSNAIDCAIEIIEELYKESEV